MDEYTLPVDCVTSMNNHLQPLMVTVTIQETPVQMEVNTAATLSLISHSTLSSLLPEAELKPSIAKLRTYTGEEIRVKGVIEVKVKYGQQTKDLTLTIVDGNGPTLLGRQGDRQTGTARYLGTCQVLALGSSSRAYPQEGQLHSALRSL